MNPSIGLWYCETTTVMVRDGAALPMVDLETGERGDALARIRRKFARLPYMLNLWFGFMPLIRFLPLQPAAKVAVFIVLVIALPLLIHKLFARRWHFTVYANPAGEMARGKRERIRKCITILAAVSCLIPAALILYNPNALMVFNFPMIYLSGTAGLLLLGICGWDLFNRSGLRITIAGEGWLRISNVHPTAIHALREIERNAPPARL